MFQLVKEIIGLPKELQQLVDCVNCGASETVAAIKKNGVALEPIRVKPK